MENSSHRYGSSVASRIEFLDSIWSRPVFSGNWSVLFTSSSKGSRFSRYRDRFGAKPFHFESALDEMVSGRFVRLQPLLRRCRFALCIRDRHSHGQAAFAISFAPIGLSLSMPMFARSRYRVMGVLSVSQRHIGNAAKQSLKE